MDKKDVYEILRRVKSLNEIHRQLGDLGAPRVIKGPHEAANIYLGVKELVVRQEQEMGELERYLENS